MKPKWQTMTKEAEEFNYFLRLPSEIDNNNGHREKGLSSVLLITQKGRRIIKEVGSYVSLCAYQVVCIVDKNACLFAYLHPRLQLFRSLRISF